RSGGREADLAQHVARRRDHDEAGAEMVQAANEPPGGRAADEPHTLVGVIGRGRVVKRQERAGQHLHADERQEHAAESEEPAGARRHRLVEEDLADPPHACACIEPLDESPAHNRTSTAASPASTRGSTESSGRGGGPLTTLPDASYTPP